MSTRDEITDGARGDGSAGENGNDLVFLTILLVRHFRFLLLVTIIGAVAITALTFLMPKMYRASARIVPMSRLGEGSGIQMPSLLGASSLLGINLNSGDPSSLFSALLHNNQLVNEILDLPFAVDGREPETLARLINPEFDGTEEARSKLIMSFSRMLHVGTDLDNGITTVAVEMKDPRLAADVVNACVQKLEAHYNGLSRKRAGETVAFLDSRIEEAETVLQESEDALQAFLETNRDTSSPMLQLKRERLARDVLMKKELYISLSSQLEVTRAEVYKNLSSILVVDEAVPIFRKVKPKRPLFLVVGVVVSFIGGVLFLVARSSWRQYRRYVQD